MSEEPLFDASFKKKSKRKVFFSEDPLGADADPTQPAPDVIDNRTVNGEAVDMGLTTAHEQITKQQQTGEADDDLKPMFGDVKKKKKPKKEIPLDLVRVTTSIIPPSIYLTCPQGEEGSGTATPTTAAAADDLDFSDLKKKKKKKKAAFDLEAFEKELSQSKAKDEEPDADEAGGEPDGRHLDEINEDDLGEDVFAHSHETPAGVDSQNEPWLTSDRDYTYQEVSLDVRSFPLCLRGRAATSTFLRSTSCLEPCSFLLQH